MVLLRVHLEPQESRGASSRRLPHARCLALIVDIEEEDVVLWKRPGERAERSCRYSAEGKFPVLWCVARTIHGLQQPAAHTRRSIFFRESDIHQSTGISMEERSSDAKKL